jgi:hypothetical protein
MHNTESTLGSRGVTYGRCGGSMARFLEGFQPSWTSASCPPLFNGGMTPLHHRVRLPRQAAACTENLDGHADAGVVFDSC